MLKLKNITKVYKTGTFEQSALKGINLEFRTGEFVAILGTSGSGKTTTLNIIGGLDQYTEGDLEINGNSTKNFNESDWDAYRNHSVGFIFQSYNLINHISVFDNVELGMTLSGISKVQRKEKALAVLNRVGLSDHIHKKPNELSGGQKQRVAIARALVNNPDIILADEPTGALDSKTSKEIMELITEISKDKLVIMVTHDSQTARDYANRIVELKDGLVIKDSNPVNEVKQTRGYHPKKTAMSFLMALKLSFNNLKTKLTRTMITALAGSIGIIGVSLVLSISNGMNEEIANLESEQLADMPILITEKPTTLPVTQRPIQNDNEEEEIEVEEGIIVPYDPTLNNVLHKNTITKEYIEYIESLDETLYDSIRYQLALQMKLILKKDNSALIPVAPETWSELPDNSELIDEQYEMVYGQMPENANQLLLVIDEYNQLNQNLLSMLGFSLEDEITYESLIGTELVIAKNDNYYVHKQVTGVYEKTANLEVAYDNGFKTEIVGIARPKKNDERDEVNQLSRILSSGLWYTPDLTARVLENTVNSQIAIDQLNVDYNVLTGLPFTEYQTKEDVLKTIGANTTPAGIAIYAEDFDSKTEIKDYLELWNADLSEDQQIVYTDYAEDISSVMTTMISLIQSVLVAFAAISLVVSSIMIGIITYVSVLERTKEIGVLRSLGARKKDISRVFNAETIIVGFFAGTLGIGLTYLLTFPVNIILGRMMEFDNIARMSMSESILLIGVSVLLTLISGLIPSGIASRKNPVEALRTE
ncbi:ABC transporter ATP-binding protein/permease [Haloplasma contractile]|uniref:Lipoprotein-releasing system ATP-binding protein n=1 Tax=Haloplasma contractile SSD-17B TaxID=1033810 RepID=F7PSC0_9MOLU|nr:ABC transporter ATP-binding protein/permease [Haloplasma contractile]ERJ11037.1 lipoprotein-releasing system ATP-binding protein [Haloplasma contractile SSD-17B]